ncbi:hydroxyacylglutathione hydrolase [Lacimicrobium sp. SS2-24]|uniref:hydroxyacylglutathione hydrolase n=1 Tax=Lacimicrobium sp. SS2-24 TaxID=2005569 RepID=UPI001FEFA22E|nr:hydroxyacylglutathione hydrolase [Lacimicrobium sp. SS2-24]
MEVLPVSAFKDNYIWCLIEENRCTVVDPGDAEPVLQLLDERGLTLTDILITHHHWDHTNGLDALVARYPDINVFGPMSRTITQITHSLKEGDTCKPDGLSESFRVLEVPGHTLDHIAFFNAKVGLFCGDTLFSGGCGRLFEGTAGQMFRSLNKLTALPENTAVYCAHEYTLANLDFALQVEPDNDDLKRYQHWAQQQRAKRRPTLPSQMEKEKRINPFLRAHVQRVAQRVSERTGCAPDDAEKIFAEIRHWKDNF